MRTLDEVVVLLDVGNTLLDHDRLVTDLGHHPNLPKLVTAYHTDVPDASLSAQRVAFGTLGHRGSAFGKAFIQ